MHKWNQYTNYKYPKKRSFLQEGSFSKQAEDSS